MAAAGGVNNKWLADVIMLDRLFSPKSLAQINQMLATMYTRPLWEGYLHNDDGDVILAALGTCCL